MSAAASGRPVEILLVEDNPGDVGLTRETLKDSKLLNHMSVVGDGVEAMALSAPRRQVRQCNPSGPHPAGPEPAEERRP